MFNVTIKFRLIATMLFMGIMLTVGGLMGIYGVKNSNSTINELFTNQMPSLEALGNSRIDLLRARTAIDRSIAHPEASGNEANLKRVEDFLAQSDKDWKKYLSLPADADEQKVSNSVQSSRDKFLQEAFTPMLTAIKAGDKEKADQLNMTIIPPLFSDYSEKMLALNAFQIKKAESMLANSQTAFKIFTWVAILGVLAGLIAVAISAYFLLSAISHPLHFALKQFDAIGKGDLSQSIQVKSNDEMGQLLGGLEGMRQNLVQTVTIVRQGSASIAISSGEIASGNMDLSARTENQAASLEETASSMEELTSTVQQNADNARQANTLALKASGVASKGGQVVGDVVHTMSSIKDSSKKIVDIIGVIDGIAFQTNILALNAAVEAARAGEQGRGFAVVAEEVRNLAQRAESSSREISAVIAEIQQETRLSHQQMQQSVVLADQSMQACEESGSALASVQDQIKSVVEQINKMFNATTEQAQTLSQMLGQIREVASLASNSSHEAGSALMLIDGMQGRAQDLNRLVAQFRF